MNCPSCGSENYTQFRRPRNYNDKTFRRHKCIECGRVFPSVQAAITEDVADLLLAEIEE